MLHPARRVTGRLVLALLAAPLLAGCATPLESGGPTTTPPTDPVTTTPTTNGTRTNGFLVHGPTIAPADGRESTILREDDAAVVTYALENDGATTANFLVTFLLNGEVESVENVQLESGKKREFQHTVSDLWDHDKLHAEVRAGASRADAEASVEPWPRTRDEVDLGPVAVRVNRWLKAPDGMIDVNLTARRDALPSGDYSQLRARTLCVDAEGKIREEGNERPNVPEPGASAMTDLRLPGCPDTLYGVAFTGVDGEGGPIHARILFVEAGWRPASAQNA